MKWKSYLLRNHLVLLRSLQGGETNLHSFTIWCSEQGPVWQVGGTGSCSRNSSTGEVIAFTAWEGLVSLLLLVVMQCLNWDLEHEIWELKWLEISVGKDRDGRIVYTEWTLNYTVAWDNKIWYTETEWPFCCACHTTLIFFLWRLLICQSRTKLWCFLVRQDHELSITKFLSLKFP